MRIHQNYLKSNDLLLSSLAALSRHLSHQHRPHRERIASIAPNYHSTQVPWSAPAIRYSSKHPASYLINDILESNTSKMHLMYYLDSDGKRVYTLKASFPSLVVVGSLLFQFYAIMTNPFLFSNDVARTIRILNSHISNGFKYSMPFARNPTERNSFRKNHRKCSSCTVFP